MSNEELEKFRIMQSALLEQFLNLHNKSIHFCSWPDSSRATADIRRTLREIRNISRMMQRHAKLVYKEGVSNRKELKRLNRESKEKARLFKKGTLDVNNK